jgi:hypothetical protein
MEEELKKMNFLPYPREVLRILVVDCMSGLLNKRIWGWSWTWMVLVIMSVRERRKALYQVAENW